MINYKWYLKELKAIEKNGYKVFSCFSCGGGSSMGYKLGGFEVVGNCEIDPAMNMLYKQNLHPRYSYEMGVQDFKLLQDLPEELFGIDVLDGSPPCSTFSLAGEREKNWGKEKKFREGQAEQILSDLFFEYLDVAEKLLPKIIVAENVEGLVQGNAKSYVNAILKRLDEIGYEPQIFLLNAATMGVPQKRKRVFIISRRKDLHLPKLKLNFNEKPICYGEFASDEYIPFSEDSMYYKRWSLRRSSDRCVADTVNRTEKGKLSGFTSSYLKKNEVAATLTAGGTPYVRFDVCGKPTEKDLITIGTFPQDYDFMGKSAQYVCGMSVPPLMMYGIASEIKKQLLDYE